MGKPTESYSGLIVMLHFCRSRALPLLTIALVVGPTAVWAEIKPTPTPPIVPGDSQKKASPTGITDRPGFKLITTGSNPSQTLRYQPTVGSRQVLTGKLSLTAQVSALGNPLTQPQLPDVALQLETTVKQVATNGDITYQLKYTKVDAEGQLTGTAAKIRDRLKSTLEGATGDFVMDSQGGRKSGSIKLPNPKDEVDQTLVNQLTQSLDSLNVPLPAEQVGIGGEWQSTTVIPVRDRAGKEQTRLTQVATYKLVDLKDGLANVTVALQQTGDISGIAIPTIGGLKVQLKGFQSDGSGQMGLSLKQVMPSKVDLSLKTNVQIETAPGSGPLPIPIALDANSTALLRLSDGSLVKAAK
jgi:hypothetical protein